MNKSNICKFSVTRSSDLVCHDFVYETEDKLREDSLFDKYLMGIVINGEAMLVKTEESFKLRKGSVFFVVKDVRFSLKGDADTEYCYITFSGRRADELAERAQVVTDISVFDGYEDMVEPWLKCLNDADETNIDLFAESTVLYSFAKLRPTKKTQDDLLIKMLHICNESFTDPDFSLAAIARELGYDAKYLSFFFKRKKGVNFTAYLRDIRLKHAIFLMEQGVVSVKNTAILSGFGDALYFSKIFKQEMGISPREYIERLQK